MRRRSFALVALGLALVLLVGGLGALSASRGGDGDLGRASVGEVDDEGRPLTSTAPPTPEGEERVLVGTETVEVYAADVLLVGGVALGSRDHQVAMPADVLDLEFRLHVAGLSSVGPLRIVGGLGACDGVVLNEGTALDFRGNDFTYTATCGAQEQGAAAFSLIMDYGYIWGGDVSLIATVGVYEEAPAEA